MITQKDVKAAKGLQKSPAPMGAGQSRLAAIAGMGAAGLMLGMVAQFEGKSNDPYFDLIGVKTVCYGETRVQMRRYSDAECKDMLADGLADFAQPVLARNPELKDRPEMLAAATSLAYNIGAANYRKSSVAKKFSAKDWRGGCDAFLAWRFAGGREVAGLLNRRKHERAICLKGAA